MISQDYITEGREFAPWVCYSRQVAYRVVASKLVKRLPGDPWRSVEPLE